MTLINNTAFVQSAMGKTNVGDWINSWYMWEETEGGSQDGRWCPR